MKNYLFIILILSSYSLSSQTEVPIEDYKSYSAISGKKNGKYFKDINGLFDNFLGEWEWVDGNRKISFYLYKDENVEITIPNSSISFNRDNIFGYYIYKENDVELINTRDVLLENLLDGQNEARGGIGLIPINDGFDFENPISLSFSDYSRRVCINGSQVPISGSPGYWQFEDSTHARVGLYTAGTIYSNCEIVTLYSNFPINETLEIVKVADEAPPLD